MYSKPMSDPGIEAITKLTEVNDEKKLKKKKKRTKDNTKGEVPIQAADKKKIKLKEIKNKKTER
jgi:hypothetical protein